MDLEKSLMSSGERKGSMMEVSYGAAKHLLLYKKLVSLGVDGNIGGKGVLGVIGSKCDL